LAWALSAQRLDDAKAHPATAMHGNAFRLVDDQHGFVLVDDRQINPRLATSSTSFEVARQSGWAGCALVTGAEPVGCINPPLFTRTSPLRKMR
jgi:hypothetical protein